MKKKTLLNKVKKLRKTLAKEGLEEASFRQDYEAKRLLLVLHYGLEPPEKSWSGKEIQRRIKRASEMLSCSFKACESCLDEFKCKLLRRIALQI